MVVVIIVIGGFFGGWHVTVFCFLKIKQNVLQIHSMLDDTALRCGLTGQFMTDPVIVWTTLQPRLLRGMSYEKQALEQWLRECGD